MTDELKPKVNDNFLVEQFEDEILLYSEDTLQAIYLNDSAYTVWLLCQQDMNVGQIIGYLEEEYADQKERIREEVMTALHTLTENKVVELVHA